VSAGAVAVLPRLGFAGAGWIGRSRLEAISAAGIAHVAGVADPIGAGLDVDCLGSFAELLELDLDGVVIATPNALHAEQAVAALDRGLAVFCQKPLGRDACETHAVVEAAREADRLLGVDLSYRWSDAAHRVREEIRSGAVGDVYAAEFTFHNAYGPNRPWYYDRALAGGGCLLDLGIHLVDLALWALDFPPAYVRAARFLSPRGLEVEEVAIAELELGEAVVRLGCSWHLPAGRDCVLEASFYGAGGGVRLSNVGGSFYELRAQRLEGTQTSELSPVEDDWGGRAAVAWTRRLAHDRRFDADAEQFITVAQVLDAIYGAARCAS
jgi:predicted dehydrogenase